MITDSVEFLNRFMDEQGYEKVEDLIGLGLKYVRPVDDSIDWEEDEIVAKVDKGKCIQFAPLATSFNAPYRLPN